MVIQGFGIGLRNEHVKELATTSRAIDWLEIIPENWIDLGGLRRRDLDRVGERWPLVPHSITMSIGGPSPLAPDLFRAVTQLCHDYGAPYWSDHVCYATLGNTHYGDLLPLPHSEECLDHVITRIRRATSMTDVPLVFENPTYYARMPGATMREEQFLAAVAERSGCELLLDVNNVYVNSQNHGFDPEAFIAALPLDRVRQIHLAGHTRHSEVILDTHAGPIPEVVWSLYRSTIARARRIIPTLIEWDVAIPALDAVVDELDRARREAAFALVPTEVAA